MLEASCLRVVPPSFHLCVRVSVRAFRTFANTIFYNRPTCITNDRLQDDSDVQRVIRSLFARTNLLINKFSKSVVKNVVKMLSKSYCLSTMT